MRCKTHPSSVRHVGSPLGDGSVGGERARWSGHDGGDESKDSDELHGEYDREEVVEQEESCVLLECEENSSEDWSCCTGVDMGPSLYLLVSKVTSTRRHKAVRIFRQRQVETSLARGPRNYGRMGISSALDYSISNSAYLVSS